MHILSHMHYVVVVVFSHFTDKRDHHDDESGIGPTISTDTESIPSSGVRCYLEGSVEFALN